MYQILLILLVFVAALMIGLILIQHGKGAQTGASFGSGASQTIFGSQGSGNFLSRTTAMLAAAFFILNLSLAYLTNKAAHQDPLVDFVPTEQGQNTPAPVKERGGKAPGVSDVVPE